jgi:ribonucleotide reductase beta subunit family protein with ferritin-like domain
MAEQSDIFTPNPRRFVLFPIKQKEIWDAYKGIINKTWSIEECDRSNAKNEWGVLHQTIKSFTLFVLTSSIELVESLIKKLTQPMLKDIQNAETRCLFGLLLREHFHVQEAFSMFHEEADRSFLEKRVGVYEGTPIMFESKSLSSVTRDNWIDIHKSENNFKNIALIAIVMQMFFGTFSVLRDGFWKERIMTGHAQMINLIMNNNAKFVDALCRISSRANPSLPPLEMKAVINSAFDVHVDHCMININDEKLLTLVKTRAEQDRKYLYGKYGCPFEVQVGGWDDIINNMKTVDLTKISNTKKTDLPEKLAQDGGRYVPTHTESYVFSMTDDF